MEQTLSTSCSQCQQQFNISNKMPIIVCLQTHTHSLCLECVKNLTLPFVCPICSAKICKQKVKLNQTLFQSLGGQTNTNLAFRYLYYKEQLRLMPVYDNNTLGNNQSQKQKIQSLQSYDFSKNILKVVITLFLIFIIANLIIQLFMVFTEQEQCIDWDEHPHSYTIRDYLKLNILVNVGCFSLAAALFISNHSTVINFTKLYGKKLLGIFIMGRLLSQVWMWSYFMFAMQPQCSTFTFLYLHSLTLGYYLFTILFVLSFAYFCVKCQKLEAIEQ